MSEPERIKLAALLSEWFDTCDPVIDGSDELANWLHARGVRVAAGAGDRPPAPSDADARYKAALRDTAQRAGIKAYWDYLDALPATEQAQPGHQANALLDCVNAALFAVESFDRQRAGAVRPTPRAALTLANLEALIQEYLDRTHWARNVWQGAVSPAALADYLLPRLGAASPAAAPPQEGK